MKTVADYLRCRYEDGARGPTAFDCYGMAIDARVTIFGRRALPSLGWCGRAKLRENTHAFKDNESSMIECKPVPGAIAAAFDRDLLTHVGVVVEVDGQLKILDTNPGGPKIRTVRDFESCFQRVAYYDDRIFQ
jgi:hypothetical protein